MIVPLHLALCSAFNFINRRWQFFETRLFLLIKQLPPATSLVSERSGIKQIHLFANSSIQCLQTMKNLVTQGSINVLIGEINGFFDTCFIARLSHPCSHRRGAVMGSKVLDCFCEHGLITARSGHGSSHVIELQALWYTP